jgi:hypothetical protein
MQVDGHTQLVGELHPLVRDIGHATPPYCVGVSTAKMRCMMPPSPHVTEHAPQALHSPTQSTGQFSTPPCCRPALPPPPPPAPPPPPPPPPPPAGSGTKQPVSCTSPSANAHASPPLEAAAATTNERDTTPVPQVMPHSDHAVQAPTQSAPQVQPVQSQPILCSRSSQS